MVTQEQSASNRMATDCRFTSYLQQDKNSGASSELVTGKLGICSCWRAEQAVEVCKEDQHGPSTQGACTMQHNLQVQQAGNSRFSSDTVKQEDHPCAPSLIPRLSSTVDSICMHRSQVSDGKCRHTRSGVKVVWNRLEGCDPHQEVNSKGTSILVTGCEWTVKCASLVEEECCCNVSSVMAFMYHDYKMLSF